MIHMLLKNNVSHLVGAQPTAFKGDPEVEVIAYCTSWIIIPWKGEHLAI